MKKIQIFLFHYKALRFIMGRIKSFILALNILRGKYYYHNKKGKTYLFFDL